MLKTIKIKEKTRQKLLQKGRKGESFDDVINRLIENATRKR